MSRILSLLSGAKTYLIAGLGILAAVLWGLLSASKAKMAKKDQQDAEAKVDILVKANENISKASKEGKKHAKDAIDRADDGDWSGFN